MGDQLAEVELHLDPGVRPAERLAVDPGAKRPVQLAVPPGISQGVGRDRDRRAGAPGLALEEAEALGQLVRDQPPERDVVEEYHQLDVAARRIGVDPHGHVVGDHRDLGLEVDAERLVGHQDLLGRPEEPVRGRLVHQRVGEEALGQLGATRPAHQLDVVEVGAAVGELIRPRQGRGHGRRVERHALAPLEPRRDLTQPGLDRRPIVERRLQRRRHVGNLSKARKVLADDHQPAITPMPERREFHDDQS